MILPFSPSGANAPRTTSVASANVQLLAAPVPNLSYNVRAVNSGSALAYVNFGDNTVTATSANIPILGNSERVLQFPPTATYAAALASSGTGQVDFQLGFGV
jgi:hypothetical protein